MIKNQFSFVALLFVGYLGNVLLLSSYFDTQAAPMSTLEVEQTYFTQQEDCLDDIILPTTQVASLASRIVE